MTRTLRLVTYNLQRAIHYDRIREHFATLSAFRQADIVAVQEAGVPAGGPNTLASSPRTSRASTDAPTAP